MPSARTLRRGSISWLNRLSPVVPPILLAAYPLLSLFQHNQSEIDSQVLWKQLGVAAATAVALFVLLRLVLRRGAKAGVVASLVVVWFFYYGIARANMSLPDSALFPLWTALFAIGVVVVLRTKSDLVNLNRILGVFAAAILVVPVGKIAIYRIDHPPVSTSDSRIWPTRLEALPGGVPRPDIYFIIPDDYARTDVLKRYFHFDNSGFIRELRKRGFVIADQARSPYSKSELNMASALNLDYLSRLPKILGPKSQDVLLARRMIHDSRASRLLKSLGYRYVHIDSDNITFAADNPHISPLAAPDNLTYQWLRNSVLRLVGGPFGFNEGATNERFRKSVRSAFDHLEAVPNEPGPKFVLFHTLLPHDPYVFGARGQSVTFPDRSDTGHSTRRGMQWYARQLQYVNRRLLRATDAILARSKTPPIIIVQTDEGFEARPEDWGEKAVRDMRVKGLSAFYLPTAGKPGVPQDLNTVNTFRFLFDRTFGARYPLLPNVSHPELDLPYQFEPMRVR